MRAIAVVAAGDHFVIGDERRGADVAAALPRIIDRDFPRFPATRLIEGHKIVIDSAEEDLAVADRKAAVLHEAPFAAGY